MKNHVSVDSSVCWQSHRVFAKQPAENDVLSLTILKKATLLGRLRDCGLCRLRSDAKLPGLRAKLARGFGTGARGGVDWRIKFGVLLRRRGSFGLMWIRPKLWR